MALSKALALLEHPGFKQVLAEHPELALKLKEFQQNLHKFVLVSSQELAREIRKIESPPLSESDSTLQLDNIAKLRAASAKLELNSRSSKKTAEDCVLSMVANADNPDWNPQDPTTYRRLEQSLLLKIMNAELG